MSKLILDSQNIKYGLLPLQHKATVYPKKATIPVRGPKTGDLLILARLYAGSNAPMLLFQDNGKRGNASALTLSSDSHKAIKRRVQ